MFSGRLSASEIDTWLDLLQNTSKTVYEDRKIAKAFLHLEESITFVSSLENEIIGGTSIYRDKTRLGMVLTSVAVKKEFRNTAAYQIVKSSLPFFKTVAIRDADALVALEDSLKPIGFPLSLELDLWVGDVIKRIGFEETGILHHCTFKIKEPVENNPFIWDKEKSTDKARELIWEQGKPMGLTNSLVWTSLDFSKKEKSLVIAVEDDQTVGVAGFWKLADTLCVSPLVTDPKILNWDSVAESIVAEAIQKGVQHIDIPLIGKGQQELIRALEKWCSCLSCRNLSLLRKSL